jgi:hypothetical protein
MFRDFAFKESFSGRVLLVFLSNLLRHKTLKKQDFKLRL